MNIGLEIVSSVIGTGKIGPVLDAGLNDNWLRGTGNGSEVIFAGQDRQAFQWILSYWNRHRKVPSKSIFEENFPYESYRLSDAGISLDELADLAADKVNGHLVADLIGRTIDLHDASQFGKAITLLQSESARLGTGIKYRKAKAENISDPDFDIELFLSQELEMGVPFGITPVDESFYGFQPTHLVSLLGRQKAGKTTFMLNSALNAWREGFTVLYFSIEMDTDMLRQRLYCLGSHVNPSRMRRGTLRDTEKERVRSFHSELTSSDEDEGRFYISKKRAFITVDEIMDEVHQVNPHVVYVDGFDFLIDSHTRKSTLAWEANEQVSGELKTMAMDEGIIFVVATQVQEKQYRPKFGIEAGTISGGTGLLKKSDLVIGLDRTDGVHTINCVFSRYEHFDDVVVEVDWDSMNLTIIEDPKDVLAEKGI